MNVNGQMLFTRPASTNETLAARLRLRRGGSAFERFPTDGARNVARIDGAWLRSACEVRDARMARVSRQPACGGAVRRRGRRRAALADRYLPVPALVGAAG